MDTIKISVVTVVCNDRTVEDTIISIINQTYFTNIEYVVIDGSSSDGTLDIIKKYSGYITCLISEPDHGVYDAMNKALAAVTGDYVNFMNAGDIFADNNSVQKVVEKIDKSPDVIFGDCILDYGQRKKLLKTIPFYKRKQTASLCVNICHQSVFIKKSVAKKYGFRLKFRICADYDLLKRIYSEGFVFQQLDFPIAVYKFGNGLSSTPSNYKKVLIENALINEKLFTLDFLISYIKAIVWPKFKDIIKSTFFYVSSSRYVFHLIVFYLHPKKKLLRRERDRWIQVIKNKNVFSFKDHLWLFKKMPEYRSIFYHRLGRGAKLLSWSAKGKTNLQIDTLSENIGACLVIQHGFSSIINAMSIGENVQIWHNVTIGVATSHTNTRPTIGNNVKIYAGAIVIGDIHIGNNVVIGAGAVVIKDVPDNCVVVGNPAYVIKQNGLKVHIR